MSAESSQRVVEVRLIVSAFVKLDADGLMEALAAAGPVSSVGDVVASEIASNLESLSYVEAAYVSRL